MALDRIAASEPQGAEAICQDLLLADSTDQAALLLLGVACIAQADAERARAALVRVAHLRSQGHDPRYELACVLVRLHCRGIIPALYQDCVRHAPEDDALRYCAAECLREANALAEARELLVDGLRRQPDWPAAHQLLGIVLAELGQTGAAIGQFRRVVALVPDQPAGWGNLGAMLRMECRFDAALRAYDRAVALDPDNPRLHVNRTVARLHAGRFREAWSEFEWRVALPEHQGLSIERLMPPLSRVGDLTGRTILVTHEEGFGDTLQFMRYVPLLAERGARVLVWVPKPLVSILQGVAGVAEVLSDDCPAPPFDFHCPFVSLPRVFDTDLASIPHRVPYMSVEPELVERWGVRLPDDGMRVGLVWAGQGRPHIPGFDVVDARRSMALADLAPLGRVDGVRFITLQVGAAAEQASEPPEGLTLLDPMADAADFADTAAIIANLHVVVSVDTSVAHLAGAMGKPVLLLDRYDNCWRWLSGRTDSPWYPSLRIFRQKRLGEWGPVVQRVASALRALAAEHTARHCHPSPVPNGQDAA